MTYSGSGSPLSSNILLPRPAGQLLYNVYNLLVRVTEPKPCTNTIQHGILSLKQRFQRFQTILPYLRAEVPRVLGTFSWLSCGYIARGGIQFSAFDSNDWIPRGPESLLGKATVQSHGVKPLGVMLGNAT